MSVETEGPTWADLKAARLSERERIRRCLIAYMHEHGSLRISAALLAVMDFELLFKTIDGDT